MNKFLFSLIFGFALCISSSMNAQSANEPINSNQNADDGILVAYPNPAKDVLFVKTKDSSVKIQSITFYSILGAKVADYKVNTHSGEIRLDKLKSGKYLMAYVLSDNTQKVTQIIKQ